MRKTFSVRGRTALKSLREGKLPCAQEGLLKGRDPGGWFCLPISGANCKVILPCTAGSPFHCSTEGKITGLLEPVPSHQQVKVGPSQAGVLGEL